MVITTIIFDCFGVLVTDTLVAFRDRHFGNSPDLAREIDDMTRAIDLGYLGKHEFHRRISEMNGMAPEEIRRVLEGGSVLDESMMDLVRILKKSFSIGMLSNISPERLDDFFSGADKQLFDALTLSYEIGCVKPDERAYQAALAQLGVLAEEAIFIDDQPRNVEAARAVGIEAILFTGRLDLRQKLANYGILTP